MMEHLLGFDARAPLDEVDRSWSAERRDLYLLRPVARPLSTDVLVWPSVFGDFPGWRGPNQELWDDLDRMRAQLAGLGPRQLIAVSWMSGDDFAEGASLTGPYPYLGPTNPSERSPGWPLLGYDVSDGSLLSGLSNCGYSKERDRHRERWGPHLNEHHLFGEVAQVFAFRAACDLRVPEHAPFFVFGLWVIEEPAEGGQVRS